MFLYLLAYAQYEEIKESWPTPPNQDEELAYSVMVDIEHESPVEIEAAGELLLNYCRASIGTVLENECRKEIAYIYTGLV